MVHTLEPMDPVSAAVEGGATTLHKQMRKLLSLLIAPPDLRVLYEAIPLLGGFDLAARPGCFASRIWT